MQMDSNEYKRQIIETLEQMGESDRKFLRQIFTLLRMHAEREERGVNRNETANA